MSTGAFRAGKKRLGGQRRTGALPMLGRMGRSSRSVILGIFLAGAVSACGPDVQVYTFDGVRTWRSIEWQSGRRHGRFVEYHPEGPERLVGSFHRGRLDGDWRESYPSGRPKAERHYSKGLRQGTWIEWYESGTKRSEEIWRDGDRDGPASRWSEDGAVSELARWEKGTRVEVHVP